MKAPVTNTPLAVLSQGLACICGCLLALFLALGLTLFREGYYLHQLENSGCLQTLYGSILQASHNVAQTAGLREDILDGLVSQEMVRVAVFRRADQIWHGAAEQPETPYTNLVSYLQDTVTQETGEMWDESDAGHYNMVRTVCLDMWDTNTVPPLSNLLNILMQYRQVCWILVVVLAVLFLVCLWFQIPFNRGWDEVVRSLFSVGIALVLAGIICSVVIQFSGWESWMPTSDPGYDLYFLWFRGFPPTVAACNLILAVLLWVAALACRQVARPGRPVCPKKLQNGDGQNIPVKI